MIVKVPLALKRALLAMRSPLIQAPNSVGGRLVYAFAVCSIVLLFVGVGAFGMVVPSATDLPPPEQVVLQDVVAIPDEALARTEATAGADAPFITETHIQPGDTVASVLKRLKLTDTRLLTAITSNTQARSIYKLRPGRTVLVATTQDGDFLWLRYIHTPGTEANGRVIAKMLEVKAVDGSFTFNEIEEQTETHIEVGMGTITRSLFAATDVANIPDGITSQMADILGSKIDFLRGLRKGDQFRVVYETRAHEGRSVGTGRVLALQFVNQGKSYSAVWFNSDDNKSGGYYSLEGETLRGVFLRNALKFSRISSTFGTRRDPILGSWSGHAGVDYAAPTGTPIQATADGIIDYIGWQNGYGNVIILRHPGNITVVYGHQSAFAPDLVKGSRIAQGQTIGYVGSTGWSTGAHLHYEFRINDKPVDPLTVALPESPPIEAEHLPTFVKAVAPLKQQLEVLAKFQPTAAEESASIAQQ